MGVVLPVLPYAATLVGGVEGVPCSQGTAIKEAGHSYAWALEFGRGKRPIAVCVLLAYM